MFRMPGCMIAITLGYLVAAPGSAHAQGTARSLDLDPSVRAAGMGAASNAVFWDGGNQWSNPALLGYERGIRYEWSETQLVPDLAAGVYFHSNVVKLGGGGAAVSLSGRPGIGGLKLDYGLSEGSDETGNPTGTFGSFEEIESWGFGISLGQLTESIARLSNRRLPALSRYGDVSVGMYSKEALVQLGPNFAFTSRGRDLGVLARVSPLEWFATTRDGLVDFDLAYGWSDLSYDGETDRFLLASDPPSEHKRRGGAARIGVAWPEQARGVFGRHQWLADGMSPLVSVGMAMDHDEISPGAFYETDGRGVEIGLANVFAFRTGSYEDLDGEIDGSTQGWSIGLPVGRLAGLRYDRAEIPQATGLSKVDREAFSLWVDPLEIWSVLNR